MNPLRVLLIALLCLTAGCAATETHERPATVKPAALGWAETLRPYLGRWRPTSFAEQQNIISLTIGATDLTFEIGGTWRFSTVSQRDGAVVVQWTSHAPPAQDRAGVMGFVLQQQKQTDSAGQPSTEEVLWIYWCDNLSDLSGEVEHWHCTKNLYMR
jgi:hypothetical protein